MINIEAICFGEWLEYKYKNLYYPCYRLPEEPDKTVTEKQPTKPENSDLETEEITDLSFIPRVVSIHLTGRVRQRHPEAPQKSHVAILAEQIPGLLDKPTKGRKKVVRKIPSDASKSYQKQKIVCAIVDLIPRKYGTRYGNNGGKRGNGWSHPGEGPNPFGGSASREYNKINNPISAIVEGYFKAKKSEEQEMHDRENKKRVIVALVENRKRETVQLMEEANVRIQKAHELGFDVQSADAVMMEMLEALPERDNISVQQLKSIVSKAYESKATIFKFLRESQEAVEAQSSPIFSDESDVESDDESDDEEGFWADASPSQENFDEDDFVDFAK